MTTDPVCKMDVEPAKAAATIEYAGQVYYFCSAGCHKAFSAAPQTYVGAAPHGGRGESGSHHRGHE